jgi:hypothetical protein
MDFLTARLQAKQQIKNMQMNPQAYRTPVVEPEKEPVKDVKVKKERKKKEEFVVADDKEEIISDIISSKPKISDLRKALKEYANMAQEENDDID